MLKANRKHWITLGLGLSLPIIFSIAMLIAPAPYLHDYAEWLYQSEIVRLLIGGSHKAEAFQLAPYPVPYSLLFLILGSLSFLLPSLWAGKIFLIGLVWAWTLVLWVFSQRYGSGGNQPALFLTLLGLAGFSTFFWTGFISYQLGLLIFTLYLAQGLRNRSILAYALFSIALFFSHAMVFLVFLLVVGVQFLNRPDWRVVVGLIPSAFLSIWYLAGRWISGYASPSAAADWSGWQEMLIYKAGYPAMIGPFRNFLQADGSSLLESMSIVYYLGFAINFLIAAMFAAGILFLLVKLAGSFRQLTPSFQVAYISLGALSLLYLVAPYEFFGLTNPGGRLLIPMLLLTCLIAARHNSRGLVAASVVIFPTSLACILAYAFLVSTTALEDVPLRAGVPPGSPPAQSVLSYNDWIYSATRYRYFNYRIFAMSNKFSEVENEEFHRLGLDIGLIQRKPD